MTSKFEAWRRAYERAAKADGNRTLVTRLEEEGYVDPEKSAESAIDETISLMECIVLRGDKAGILPLQVYHPAEARAPYVLSFQGGRWGRVRLYFDELSKLDLVEIHDEGAGFESMTIDLVRPGKFSPGECDHLQELVRADFAYDYCDDEIKLEFNSGPDFLQVEITPLW